MRITNAGTVFAGGEGENLFAGLDLASLGYKPTRTIAGERATHILIKKT